MDVLFEFSVDLMVKVTQLTPIDKDGNHTGAPQTLPKFGKRLEADVPHGRWEFAWQARHTVGTKYKVEGKQIRSPKDTKSTVPPTPGPGGVGEDLGWIHFEVP